MRQTRKHEKGEKNDVGLIIGALCLVAVIIFIMLGGQNRREAAKEATPLITTPVYQDMPSQAKLEPRLAILKVRLAKTRGGVSTCIPDGKTCGAVLTRRDIK